MLRHHARRAGDGAEPQGGRRRHQARGHQTRRAARDRRILREGRAGLAGSTAAESLGSRVRPVQRPRHCAAAQEHRGAGLFQQADDAPAPDKGRGCQTALHRGKRLHRPGALRSRRSEIPGNHHPRSLQSGRARWPAGNREHEDAFLARRLQRHARHRAVGSRKGMGPPGQALRSQDQGRHHVRPFHGPEHGRHQLEAEQHPVPKN